MSDITPPIDPVKTNAWQALGKHYEQLQEQGIDLARWFDQDKDRCKNYSWDIDGLHFDLSKNLIVDETKKLLCDLAQEVGLQSRIEAMYTGEHINTTEDRAVLHTALRRPRQQAHTLIVDGQDCVSDVHDVLDKMYAFADEVRQGKWTGVTGKPISHILSIGIGGSDLGPVMAYEALAPYADAGIDCRFISNIDPCDMAEKVKGINPEETLCIIVSKTFTTLETLTNAKMVRSWLLDTLVEKGCIQDSEEDRKKAVSRHFVAVSTAIDKVEEFGIDPAHAFGFWNWVGGRYSVDAAVGLSLIICLGKTRFEDFLAGFHSIDTYFETTPVEDNVVALMGLINIWYVNFFGAASHAVLPYSQYLHRFPAYLQQLTMESNGKSTRWDGTAVTTDTGEIFWGEPGTNGQHAFYQLIHQGTRMVPADFIAFVNTAHPKQVEGQDVHQLLLANFLAQTKALAFGKDADEVRREGTDEWMVQARVFTGNRPTTSILGERLDPYTLGQLIALYEHITFVEGCVWGINSYDQWGVELGKQLAKQIVPAFEDKCVRDEEDPSTRSLLEYYCAHKD